MAEIQIACTRCGNTERLTSKAIDDMVADAIQQERERVGKLYVWGITFNRDILKLLIEAIKYTPSEEVVLLSTLDKMTDKCEAALKELEAEGE